LKNPELFSKSVYYQLSDLFEISAIYYHGGRLILRARPHLDQNEAISIMNKRLNSSGFSASVKEDAQGLLIAVKESSVPKIPYLNILLFVTTLATMFLAPAILGLSLDYFRHPGAIAERIEFTVALILILLFHEFGHYLAGRRRGVLMSLPYFIPAPNLVGTFGAIIKSRSPFTNRRDLIEVGAAGPIAGFVISIIALSIGLYRAELVPLVSEGSMQLGDSLLIKFLTRIIVGPMPDGVQPMITQIGVAGWFGLLLTMINLLPLGQLDGGHIIYGLLGKSQHNIGKVFIVLMAILGFWWPGWWLFGVLVILFRIKHPQTFNDSIPLSSTARILGFSAIIIFIISFVPVPFILD